MINDSGDSAQYRQQQEAWRRVVRYLKGLTAGDKIVLLALQEYQNKGTGHAYPSNATLADECGLGREKVNRALRAGVKAGLLVAVESGRRRHDGTQLPNVYGFTIPQGVPEWVTDAKLPRPSKVEQDKPCDNPGRVTIQVEPCDYSGRDRVTVQSQEPPIINPREKTPELDSGQSDIDHGGATDFPQFSETESQDRDQFINYFTALANEHEHTGTYRDALTAFSETFKGERRSDWVATFKAFLKQCATDEFGDTGEPMDEAGRIYVNATQAHEGEPEFQDFHEHWQGHEVDPRELQRFWERLLCHGITPIQLVAAAHTLAVPGMYPRHFETRVRAMSRVERARAVAQFKRLQATPSNPHENGAQSA